MIMNYKWVPDNFKGILATIVIVASFAYFFIITFLEKKADQQVIIAIVTANSMVLQYYYGSSQGANKKDQIISDMTSNPVATTSTGDINVDNKSKSDDKN